MIISMYSKDTHSRILSEVRRHHQTPDVLRTGFPTQKNLIWASVNFTYDSCVGAEANLVKTSRRLNFRLVITTGLQDADNIRCRLVFPTQNNPTWLKGGYNIFVFVFVFVAHSVNSEQNALMMVRHTWADSTGL